MPPVYTKSEASETGWRCYSNENVHNVPFPDWIEDHCVITGNGCQEKCLKELLEGGCQSFPANVAGHSVKFADYCMVISHKGYTGFAENGAQYTNTSGVQIYIGIAINGVLRRWREHVGDAKKALKAIKGHTNLLDYVEECQKLSYQLADVFLALAHLREFKVAVFVYKCCNDDDEMKKTERDLISEHAATNSKHGLNVRDEQTKKKNENKNVKGKKKTE